MRIRERNYRKVKQEINVAINLYAKHPKLNIILTELIRKIKRISA